MYDHHYIDDNGCRIPVSKMAEKDIIRILRDGFKVVSSDAPPDAQYWVKERLLIQLTIKKLGL
jgi:hypothetical protein